MSFDDCFEEEKINSGFAVLRNVEAPDPRSAIAAKLRPRGSRLVPALAVTAGVVFALALTLRLPQRLSPTRIPSKQHDMASRPRAPKRFTVAVGPTLSVTKPDEAQPSSAFSDSSVRRFLALSSRGKEWLEKPKKGDVCINPKDGSEMVWVPAGSFLMGASAEEIAAIPTEPPDFTAASFGDEKPQHEVRLSGYWMYKYEVTVEQYSRFCEETGRDMPTPPEWGWKSSHPIVNVTWSDASAYAEWAGASLPTEAQWEKAARGTDGRAYPWGDNWDISRCANSVAKRLNSTEPVGSFPSGASPYGCMDMAGNAAEWCRDSYRSQYYSKTPPGGWVDPQGPEKGNAWVVRGGSYNGNYYGYRCASRDAGYPGNLWVNHGLGFRLARNAALRGS
jgi:formylglycine-generating enzyme